MTQNATTRSRLGMVTLLSAPVVLAVAALVTPEVGDDGVSLVAGVSADPTRWTVGWTVTIAGAALYLVGLAHLTSRLRGRSRLAWSGLTLFWLGALGQATLAATELVIVPIAEGDRASAVAAVDRISESPQLASLFLLYLPGILFGGILLFLGLARAQLLPWWAGLLGVAGVVFGFFLDGTVPGAAFVTAAASVCAFSWLLRAPQGVSETVVRDHEVVEA